jgi:pyruvate kinase
MALKQPNLWKRGNVFSLRISLLWGVDAVRTRDVVSFEEMIAKAKRMALRHRIAKGGQRIITAGIPFGTHVSTNVVHVARLIGDELEGHKMKARRLPR